MKKVVILFFWVAIAWGSDWQLYPILNEMSEMAKEAKRSSCIQDEYLGVDSYSLVESYALSYQKLTPCEITLVHNKRYDYLLNYNNNRFEVNHYTFSLGKVDSEKLINSLKTSNKDLAISLLNSAWEITNLVEIRYDSGYNSSFSRDWFYATISFISATEREQFCYLMLEAIALCSD